MNAPATEQRVKQLWNVSKKLRQGGIAILTCAAVVLLAAMMPPPPAPPPAPDDPITVGRSVAPAQLAALLHPKSSEIATLLGTADEDGDIGVSASQWFQYYPQASGGHGYYGAAQSRRIRIGTERDFEAALAETCMQAGTVSAGECHSAMASLASQGWIMLDTTGMTPETSDQLHYLMAQDALRAGRMDQVYRELTAMTGAWQHANAQEKRIMRGLVAAVGHAGDSRNLDAARDLGARDPEPIQRPRGPSLAAKRTLIGFSATTSLLGLVLLALGTIRRFSAAALLKRVRTLKPLEAMPSQPSGFGRRKTFRSAMAR